MYFDAEFREQQPRSKLYLAQQTPTVATLKDIPAGRGGMIATLYEMRRFAREAVRAPSQTVRVKALELVRHLPPRHWRGQIAALQKFVQETIRYVRDPPGLELVATPEKTLELGQGDCDDQATLLAALLESIGHPARFMAIGLRGMSFSHVLVQTLDGLKWITVETIVPKAPGWFPPGVTSHYILKV